MPKDPDGHITESNEGNNTASDSVTVTAPDLTVTKANDGGGAILLGSSWTWTLTVRNDGNATATFEKLVGAKSLEHAVEIQSQYAKKAYDNWVAEASKIGEMYASVARDAYKPVEKVVAKAPKAATTQ